MQIVDHPQSYVRHRERLLSQRRYDATLFDPGERLLVGSIAMMTLPWTLLRLSTSATSLPLVASRHTNASTFIFLLLMISFVLSNATVGSPRTSTVSTILMEVSAMASSYPRRAADWPVWAW